MWAHCTTMGHWLMHEKDKSNLFHCFHHQFSHKVWVVKVFTCSFGRDEIWTSIGHMKVYIVNTSRFEYYFCSKRYLTESHLIHSIKILCAMNVTWRHVIPWTDFLRGLHRKFNKLDFEIMLLTLYLFYSWYMLEETNRSNHDLLYVIPVSYFFMYLV